MAISFQILMLIYVKAAIALMMKFLVITLVYRGVCTMEQYDVDRHILDMIYDDEIREDYADLVIEDLLEQIEDMEADNDN